VSLASAGLPPLGAPGLYWLPTHPIRALTGVRMDVCAFVGVAPRGPAREPVFDASWATTPCVEGSVSSRSVPMAVESWDEYVRHFGAFEGPGLLPYAVASFFENGGVRAYVVRVVHDYRLPDGTSDAARNAVGVASAKLPGIFAESALGDTEIWLRARNEGAWGNALSATLQFTTRPLSLQASAFTFTELTFERGVDIVPGATLRVRSVIGTLMLARIARVWEEWHPETGTIARHASFDATLPFAAQSAEVVEAVLSVSDGTGRNEVVDALGLAPSHPRWLARVLVEESELLYPASIQGLAPGDPREEWYDGRDLLFDARLPNAATLAFSGGLDRYRDLVPDDCFDCNWTLSDECSGDGVHALVQLDDLSLVTVPDLYSPRPIAPLDAVLDEGGATGDFCECDEPSLQTQTLPAEALDGMRLNPSTELSEILRLQRRLIDLATSLESFIVLLDVPPGLSQQRILSWREQCHSMYAAAYHPWLLVARNDHQRDAPIAINPSAVASGIIAQREIERGVQFGPANVFAAGVFDVLDRVSPVRHDALHQRAINVFLHERDGARLTAARTLSADPSYRQLSVRRLMTMLRRVLYRQMQWAVFEPNNAQLRGDIRNQLDAYLRQLFAANAFAGARAEDAFFVRCDEELNPRSSVDRGRLLAYVGVAPAEPLEFLMLQIARDGDGTLRVQG